MRADEADFTDRAVEKDFFLSVRILPIRGNPWLLRS
jgi:hypothetical protein